MEAHNAHNLPHSSTEDIEPAVLPSAEDSVIKPQTWLDRPLVSDWKKLFTIENLLVLIILLVALVSRFAMLGARTMSHDEVNHVVPSYDLFQGRGYRHDPVTHGPFQFHVVALSYFLFGDNDFTSRVPAATFSLAAVAFVLFAFRRYLGRSGALIAGLLFLISPYMLFYGRYTRNEAFIELIGVVLLYAILRYLETGDRLSMFLVTLATVMHFVVKETAFIYTAEALLFLFVIFLVEARRADRDHPKRYNLFVALMLLAMFFVGIMIGLEMTKKGITTAATPAVVTETAGVDQPLVLNWRFYVESIFLVMGLAAGAAGLFTLAKDLGWAQIKRMRSFTLLLVITTLILPLLSPFPVSMVGWNPIDYASTANMLRTGMFVALFFLIAVAIGIWWNPIVWLQNAFLFYTIFTVFYTTFFTNGDGFFTGLVGSLGYWLAQQSVQRGQQPHYYYALIQMPVYEFLGVFGSMLAVYFGVKYRKFAHMAGFAPAFTPQPTPPADTAEDAETVAISNEDALQTPASTILATSPTSAWDSAPQPLPVLSLLLYWGVFSLVAYSFAGERMPWLTVHITLPFLLAAGWGLGYLVDTTDWRAVLRRSGLLALLLLPVLFAGLTGLLSSVLGTNPPFQGNTVEQLQATNRFLLALFASGASLAGVITLLRGWRGGQMIRLAAVVFFLGLALLTARAAYRASFVNYDDATEYLVYAHAASSPKLVMQQIDEISQRITGGKGLQVAYSNDMLYPYWWYLRDYANHRWYQSNPTRDLRDFPIVLAGEDVFDKIEPVLGSNFYKFESIRLWWPNQDYYNLDWPRIWNVISNPEMRAAVFDIWLNRDYTAYGKLINQPGEVSLENWSPSARMRVYIRKDIVAQMWNYGAAPVAVNPEDTDPYFKKMIQLSPAQVIGATGSEPGQFQAPRGIAIAADGSLYVADSRNNRIQHLAADGSVLQVWGSFGDMSAPQQAADGTFNEPWGVAVGKDGSVYVSDTWNHRIQKFTADGKFIKKWGYFGQAEKPEAFWGPRALAMDAQDHLYVMDTGNKRVVVFDADGGYITAFGTSGSENGQFNEPVGIALDTAGNVYITDTWNQRVQVFAPAEDGISFTFLRAWDVTAWAGQSLENKPFIAVSTDGKIYVTDPEKPRVLEFDTQGTFLRGWGDYSTGPDGFGVASGVAVAQDGSVWVSDGGNNLLLRFEVP